MEQQQKAYPPLNKRDRRKLRSMGNEYLRTPEGDFGTFITGGINGQGIELHYEVEFLDKDRTLEKSRLLWMKNLDTNEFGRLGHD